MLKRDGCGHKLGAGVTGGSEGGVGDSAQEALTQAWRS